MDSQRILRCFSTIGSWIALAIWENASGIQRKVLAVLYKITFTAALYMLYLPESEDIQQLSNRARLFNEKFHGSVFGKTLEVEEYKRLVLAICFVGFELLLGITYWVIKWEEKVAYVKRLLSAAEFNRWVRARRLTCLIHHCVKNYAIPCFLPFFCCFIGMEGSVISLGLLNLTYLAFIFRHGYVDDLRVTNIMVAVAVYIILSPLGKESEKSMYTVLLTVVAPLCTRSVLCYMSWSGRTMLLCSNASE